MFTGIITEVGTIKSVTKLDKGRRFRISSGFDYASVDIGASISHSGACLTVTAKEEGWHEAEAWAEALQLTTMGAWQPGTRINLERSLRLGDELGGHLVSGHVDGVAMIVSAKAEGEATRFVLQAPAELAQFIAPKGSAALDGTSLTVNAVDGERFDVLLIAHTLQATTWSERRAGDRVNLEVDQMARYAARLLAAQAG